MSVVGVADRIRQFIVEELGWEGTVDDLTDNLSLIQEGALDSIGILSMVMFLESNYGVTIDDSEIIPDNLGSLASIEQYMQGKSS